MPGVAVNVPPLMPELATPSILTREEKSRLSFVKIRAPLSVSFGSTVFLTSIVPALITTPSTAFSFPATEIVPEGLMVMPPVKSVVGSNVSFTVLPESNMELTPVCVGVTRFMAPALTTPVAPTVMPSALTK